MTYIPEVPLWCWVMQGEDALFFSQPTHAFLCEPPLLAADGGFLTVGASETRWLDALSVCVARCQHQTQFCLDDQPYNLDTGAGLTPPVQCGHVARVDRRARYFCDYHMRTRWECYHCHAVLPHGEGGFCGEACRADFDAQVSED